MLLWTKKSNHKQEGSGWNREHIVPQSWFSEAKPLKNDAHHVWPTDSKINSLHAAYPFGEVKQIFRQSKNGTKIGVGLDNERVMEVINEFKGDVARAILYFWITYKNYPKKQITKTKDSRRVWTNKSINPNYLKQYLEWSDSDPITQFDLDQNNGIYKHQHNRNPFIDYPKLIDVVFKNDTKFVFKNLGFAKKLVF
ncbi:endonuclease [Mycoplasma sp. ES3225-GEN-MYC]|nr:endonuclease [Mycoplasma miroungigenitalium]